MKENLRTTKYADGTSIGQGSGTSYDVAYWYYPNNNPSNQPTHGLLYNWKAVMYNSSSSNNNPSNVQGICPTGWHIPSDAEWAQLVSYVSGESLYCCNGNTNNIGKALATTSGWNSGNVTCAVGNIPGDNNATGFSALPAGNYTSNFASFGTGAFFWGATESSTNNAYYRYMNYNNAGFNRGNFNKYFAFSVSCLCD